MSAYSRMQIDPKLSLHMKLKLMCIKDQHIKPYTINFIDEKEQNYLGLIDTGDKFPEQNTNDPTLRATINI